MIKKLLSIILSVAVALTMMPAMATVTYAEDPATSVKYIDEKGDEKTAGCTIMTSGDNYSFEAGGWYAVTSDVTINNRIENNAPADNPAHLILADGSCLTAKGGIKVEGGDGLYIYAQSEGTGKLTVTDVPQREAGIGGGNRMGCGNIVISGGVITVDVALQGGAGIGSGENSAWEVQGTQGKVIINRGELTVRGGYAAAAIGGGNDGASLEEVIINGGTLYLYGGKNAAGIGGGCYQSGSDVTVNGGKLVVYSAGGGFGEPLPAIGYGISGKDGGDLTISDGLKLFALNETGTLEKMTVDQYKSLRTGYAAIGTDEATYTVHHLLQKSDLSGYEEASGSPETYYGLAETMTVAGKKQYPGFQSVVTEQPIAADCSTELYVQHNRKRYALRFHLNGHGSNGPGTISALYGTGIEEPSVKPTAEGYVFEGWYQEEGCVNRFSFTTMPDHDVTVYAKWTVQHYTITWKDGEQILRQDTHIYNDMPNYGEDPVKQGYEFVSWWPKVQKVTGDATYKAVFFNPSGPEPVHVHTPKLVNGQKATCTSDGWKDYYQCKDTTCNKLFADIDCTTEIALDDWKANAGKLAKTGHKTIIIPQQDATADKDGVKAYYVCKNCDTCFEDAECTKTITDIEVWKKGAGKIAKHTHSYGNATYFWNDDLSECTAYHTCTTDGCGHIELETVSTTEESGKITATFTKTGFAKQSIDKPTPAHEHSFATEWSSNDARHWHAATCGCDDIVSGFAGHTWGTDDDANKCTVCGYVKQTDPEGHVHTFDTAWSRNETVHWHAATCVHTEITSNMASHEYGDDNICDVCGYKKEEPKPVHEHTFEKEWSKSSEYHWHAATCEHKDVTSGHAKHNYNAGTISKGIKTYTCQTCGYQKTEKLSVAVPKTSIKSVKRAKKAFTVKWTKKSVTGYQIQYARNSKFTKSAKTVTVKSASTVSKKIKSLKKKKRYYVRVRCYINKYDTTYYSGWTAKKAVTTK